MKMAEPLDLQPVVLQHGKGQETRTQTSRRGRAGRQCMHSDMYRPEDTAMPQNRHNDWVAC
jgi:hypothetical protein